MRTFSWADFASLFAAMQWTVALVCIALAVGAPLAWGWRSCAATPAPLRWLAAALQQLVQGVPLLGLLMFFYFGMPVFLGVEVPAIAAVSVAFIIYAAAFLGQIWHGGIQAVTSKPPRNLRTACMALVEVRNIHKRFGANHAQWRVARHRRGRDRHHHRPLRLGQVHAAALPERAGERGRRRDPRRRRAWLYFAACLPLTMGA